MTGSQRQLGSPGAHLVQHREPADDRLVCYRSDAASTLEAELGGRYQWTGDPSRADLLAVDPQALEHLESQGGIHPLAPVVVLGTRPVPDELVVAGGAAAAMEALETAGAIAGRVRELRRRGTLGGLRSLDAYVLAHAWTREGHVRVAVAGHLQGGWGYPLAHRLGVSSGGELAGVCDRLVASGALRGVPVEVAMPCPRCASLRVAFRDACVACASPLIEARPLVHHFHCAHQAAEEEFRQPSGRYVCPKCSRELRQFGLDYDKPGEMLHCTVCGTDAAEPRAAGRCLDCGATFAADDAVRLTLRDFALTAEGARLLHSGGVDAQGLADLLRGVFPLLPFGVFLVQARTLSAITRRHGLASSVLALSFADAAGQHLSVEDKARLIHHLGARLGETVRDTDVMAQHQGRILVLLAGTDAAGGRLAAERLREAARAGVGERLAGALQAEVLALESFLEDVAPSGGEADARRIGGDDAR